MIFRVSDEDSNHIEFIKICLNDAQDASQGDSQDEKEIYIKLYNYLATQALNFTLENLDVKKIAIKDAYSLKIQYFDFPELQNSLNFFLQLIGETL